MRHRITYIREPHTGSFPKVYAQNPGSLDISNLTAAKEHHLTIGLEELPDEVQSHHASFDNVQRTDSSQE